MVDAAANLAAAMAGAPPLVPLQSQPSAGGKSERLAGHKRIRILVLPVGDSLRLHMDAPEKYSIATELSSRRFDAGDRASIKRFSDFRGVVKQMRSSPNLRGSSCGDVTSATYESATDGNGGATPSPRLGQAPAKKGAMDSMKRLYDVVKRAGPKAPDKKNWATVRLSALSDGLADLSSSAPPGSASTDAEPAEESVSADAVGLQTVDEDEEQQQAAAAAQ